MRGLSIEMYGDLHLVDIRKGNADWLSPDPSSRIGCVRVA